MNQEIAPPQADSLELAFWPMKNLKRSVSRFFAAHDDTRIAVWGNDEAQVTVSLDDGAALEGDDEMTALFIWQEMEVEAAWGEQLSMWGRWWSGHYRGDLEWADDHSPITRSWHKREEERIYTDDLSGWIVADTKWGDFAIGRGAVQQGSGIGGSVILSRDAGAFSWAAWEYDAGPVRLSMMHGSLMADERDTLYADKRYPEKYLVLHRVDVKPHPRLLLYAGETVVYGNRAPEPGYLLPHTFIRITEHKLFDRDNVAIFIGFEWQVKDNLMLYGHGYLDELKKAEFFSDWWGNKYALQGGAAMEVGELPGGKPRFVIEGVAIRPWLYTHKTNVGDYTHEGYSLGYPLGANLLGGSTEINLPVRRNLDIGASVTLAKQGTVGCDPTTNYEDRPSNNASWLEGDVNNVVLARSAVVWRPLAHHYLRASVRYTDDIDNDAQLDWLFGWGVRY